MHETVFSDSFLPAPATVLGLDLLPYSIGHELILLHRRNALVIYTPESFKELPDLEKRKALGEAADICATKSEKSGAKWGEKVAGMDLDAEIEKFQAYRAAGSLDLPTIKQPRTHGVPFHYFGAPELARLMNYVTAHHALMIAAHYHGSPLDFPLGLAKILYATHLECEGAIWVKNYQDMEDEKRREAFEKSNPENTFAIGEEAVRKAAEKWNAEHPDAPIPVEPKPEKN